MKKNKLKKRRYHEMFMKMAQISAEMSFCKRSKVGAVIVKNNRVIVNAWNGTPSGCDNECEDEFYSICPICGGKDYVYNEFDESTICTNCVNGQVKDTKTKEDVIHAEMNALAYMARTNESTEGAILYVTMSPCLNCAKHLLAAGIKKVIYLEEYRDTSGIDFLKKHIKVKQLKV